MAFNEIGMPGSRRDSGVKLHYLCGIPDFILVAKKTISYENFSTNIIAACVRLGQIRFVLLKTLIFFFLALGKRDDQVIDAGREFQILEPL